MKASSSPAMWALLTLLGGCAASRPAASPPRPGSGRDDPLPAIVATGGLAGAQWGVLAVDMATGDTLLAHGAEHRLVPGSTMKLLTTATALDQLGADYRWRTEVWAGGAIDATSGVLQGDLVVIGTGDPTLSSRFGDEDREPLDPLASALLEGGVRRVTGALVVDASSWDSATVRASWMVDDLPFGYAATGGAFVVEEGVTHVELSGGQGLDEPVAARWWPYGEEGFVRSRVTTAESATEVEASYLPESHRLELTGSVLPGAVDTVTFATRDPVRQAAAALFRAVAEIGVTVEGGWRVAWEPGEAFGSDCVPGVSRPCRRGRSLTTVESPPLIEVLAGVLKPSQNWIAEQIVRTLGAGEGRRAGWEAGTAAVRAHLENVVGVEPLDLNVVDGSGLSVQGLVTPRSLVQLLQYARSRPWGSAYRAALPQPGEEEESTLSERLLELQGRLFAKTGSLTNVGSLAGYLIDRRGREIAFAVIVNGANVPAAAVREGIDAVVRGLADG